MRLLLGTIITLFMMTSNSYAGILDSMFGYKNADECILDKMKGTTSDAAAKLIYRACQKYDEIDETSCSGKILIPDVTGNGAPDGYDYFNATIYNSSDLYTITKIDIRVMGKRNKIDFNRLLRGNVSIRPLSNGVFQEKLGADSLADMSWDIVQIYGCKK
jgi:hypothetical protein